MLVMTARIGFTNGVVLSRASDESPGHERVLVTILEENRTGAVVRIGAEVRVVTYEQTIHVLDGDVYVFEHEQQRGKVRLGIEDSLVPVRVEIAGDSGPEYELERARRRDWINE